ncbi:hypothetical protein KC342_g111 [Hortaea werneckii]|nr:hypothetical protein KC342_g111 [Hortaea werneckii]
MVPIYSTILSEHHFVRLPFNSRVHTNEFIRVHVCNFMVFFKLSNVDNHELASDSNLQHLRTTLPRDRFFAVVNLALPHFDSAAYSSHLKSPSGHVQVTVKKKLGYPVAYCISRRWQKMSRHNKERTQEIDEYSRCFNNLRSPRSRQCLKTLPSQSTRTRTPHGFLVLPVTSIVTSTRLRSRSVRRRLLRDPRSLVQDRRTGGIRVQIAVLPPHISTLLHGPGIVKVCALSGCPVEPRRRSAMLTEKEVLVVLPLDASDAPWSLWKMVASESDSDSSLSAGLPCSLSPSGTSLSARLLSSLLGVIQVSSSLITCAMHLPKPSGYVLAHLLCSRCAPRRSWRPLDGLVDFSDVEILVGGVVNGMHAEFSVNSFDAEKHHLNVLDSSANTLEI